MNAREERDRRIEAERAATLSWVFNEVVPDLVREEEEQTEPDFNSVRFLRPIPVPRPRKVRIGDELFDVPDPGL